jgi:hypothetical protein
MSQTMDVFVAWLVSGRSVERCARKRKARWGSTVLSAGAKDARIASKMRAGGGDDAPFAVVELGGRVVVR